MISNLTFKEAHSCILALGGVFGLSACVLSFYLISKHNSNFTCPTIQSKINGILWMCPIYCIDSFLGLAFPSVAVYINLLRDLIGGGGGEVQQGSSSSSSSSSSSRSLLHRGSGSTSPPTFGAMDVGGGGRGEQQQQKGQGHGPQPGR